MSLSRLATCLLISASAWQAGCSCAPDVQIVGATVKRIQGEEAPYRSEYFDGKSVKLRGVRGETLGLQVLLSDQEAKHLDLVFYAKGAHAQAFRVGFIDVKEPSTAMYGTSRGPGSYPDILFPVDLPTQISGQAFIDIAISPHAEPGTLPGQLRVGEKQYPVELKVEPIRIDLSKDPLVWVFYLPREIARVHGVPEDDGEPLLEIEAGYHELFRRHGAYLATNLRPDRFPPRRKFVKNVRYWPAAVDTSTEETIEHDVKLWLEYFKDLDVTPFMIPVDEPATLNQRQRARWIAEVVGKSGGGRPRLLRGVTDSVHDIYGGVMDVYFSPRNFPKTAKRRRPRGERFWTYNGRPPGAGSMIIDTHGVALRTWGWIAYRYDIDLWYAWEGLYFSDRYNNGGPTDVLVDPITFDERSDGGEDYGNGDGLLAYPGPLPSLRLKAMRRGLQDRLLLKKLELCGGHAQAQRVAERLVPVALGEAALDANPSWPLDEAPWERARYELLDLILETCRGS